MSIANQVFNRLAVGETITLEFMCKADAVSFRNAVSMILHRKQREYELLGILEKDMSLLSSISADSKLTLSIGKRKRTRGPIAIYTLEQQDNSCQEN